MFVGVFGNVHINGAMHHYTSDVAMVILNVLLKSYAVFGDCSGKEPVNVLNY